ncbi:hypothetical protein KC960_01445 [Candidatus Saccharibacteria bacterium]|nr:hypothetical protein [Candidatus Saccharibacteria bacterium]
MARGRGDRQIVPKTAGAELYLDSKGRLRPVDSAVDTGSSATVRETGLEIALRVSGAGFEEYRRAIVDVSNRLGFRALLPVAGIVIVNADRTSPVLQRIATYLREDDRYSNPSGGEPARVKSNQTYRYMAEAEVKRGVETAWNRISYFPTGRRSNPTPSVELPVVGEPGLRTAPMDRSGAKGTEIRVNVDFGPIERRLLNVGQYLFGAAAYAEKIPETGELTLATIGLKYADARDMLKEEGFTVPDKVFVGPTDFTTKDIQQ